MMAAFKRWLKRRRIIRDKWKAVRMLRAFMKANWDSPTKLWTLGEALEERTWHIGGYTLIHSRMIRGDLIQFRHNANTLADWMDDSHQWGALFGSMRDVMVKTSSEEVKRALPWFQKPSEVLS